MRSRLPLNWPARLPNTRTALSAAEWVRRHRDDVSEVFNRCLFAAHFVLGEDIGDSTVIARHAGEAGIDLGALHAALADGTALASLIEAGATGARFGVRATPSWLVGGGLVSGLRPASEFERLARSAVRKLS